MFHSSPLWCSESRDGLYIIPIIIDGDKGNEMRVCQMSECRYEATSEIMFLCGYLLGEIQSTVLIAQIKSVVRPAVCDVLPITLQYRTSTGLIEC